MNIDFRLHPRQIAALTSKATEVLYGGAAGGGKSYLMRVAAVLWCQQIPGLQVYLFRRISEDLTRNHVEGPSGLRAMLAPWIASRYAELVEDQVRFGNKSKIYLCHCKDEKDRFKYLGAEMHVLLIDELTTFSEVIYRFLRSRVRAVGVYLLPEQRGLFPRILCGSNPGGVGHGWVKRTFIDPAVGDDPWSASDEEGGMRRQFLRARLDDNPSMTEEDPLYRQRLRGMGSTELARAYELGDWDIIAGAAFSELRRELHMLPRFRIPKHWLRMRAMDWGYTAPFAVLWGAIADGGPVEIDGQIRFLPAGAIVIHQEWYGADERGLGLKMTTSDIAQGIRDRTPDGVSYGVADPAMWDASRGPSIAEEMEIHGVSWDRGENKRVPGWQQIHQRLRGLDGRPMLYLMEHCAHLWRTLSAVQVDDRHVEDVDTSGEDHAPDALRYLCMSRPWVAEQQIAEPDRLSGNSLLRQIKHAARRR